MNAPDSSAPTPGFWSALTRLFKPAPAPAEPEPLPVLPPPVAPRPAAAPTPEVLRFAKGQGTLLRRALHPNGTVAPTPAPAPVAAEMPSPHSVLPQVILRPAATFLQASRTVLSAFRKAPPARPAAPAAPAAAKPEPASRLAPETRFERQDFPIV